MKKKFVPKNFQLILRPLNPDNQATVEDWKDIVNNSKHIVWYSKLTGFTPPKDDLSYHWHQASTFKEIINNEYLTAYLLFGFFSTNGIKVDFRTEHYKPSFSKETLEICFEIADQLNYSFYQWNPADESFIHLSKEKLLQMAEDFQAGRLKFEEEEFIYDYSDEIEAEADYTDDMFDENGIYLGPKD
jgi:hypothetical protein